MEASEIAINNPKELGELLEGRTDDEIMEVSKAIGIEAVLEKTFDGMCQAFQADKAAGQAAVIGWDISAEGQSYKWQLEVADGKCAAEKNGSKDARVTLALALPDFLRLITGKLNGQQAFFSGQLKLTGDMMFAVTQEAWFDKTWGG